MIQFLIIYSLFLLSPTSSYLLYNNMINYIVGKEKRVIEVKHLSITPLYIKICS